jgi:hypothetical protein
MRSPPRLTIDNNRINARGGERSMNDLERWAREGKVEIVSSTRLKLEAAKHPMKEALVKARSYPDVGEPFVLGQSFLDDAYLSDGTGPTFFDLAGTVFPGADPSTLSDGDANDVMHLLSHVGADGDIFVTNGKKDFIAAGKREALRERFGIVVMTDAETVAHFLALHGWT